MKKVLLFLLLVPCILLGSEVQPKPSKIEKVTVYLEGASIERIASVNIRPGENILVFNNLSPDIDESSIQISGLKNATILALNYSIDYLEKKVLSEEYKALEVKIKQLKWERMSIQNIILGYEEELQLLKKNQRINSDATDLSLEKVKEMSSYYRKRITEIKNAIYKERLSIDEIEQQLLDNGNELAKLEDFKKEKRGEINLKLDVKTATNLVLNIKYTIKNAGWFPLYDIRAINTSSPIELSYKANVYQQSGTDWKNVKVVLSTGDPNTNNTKPQILPKYLNFVNRYYNATSAVRSASYKYNPTIRTVSGTLLDDTGLPLPGVNVIEVGTSNGTQTDFDGNYSIVVKGGRELAFSYVGFESKQLPIYSSIMNVQLEAGAVLEEVVVTGYARSLRGRERFDKLSKEDDFDNDYKNIEVTGSGAVKESGITSVRFEIAKKYSIDSNAEITVIEIDKFALPAAYQHYAAPELNENVFLTATIKDWERYDLLQGEANIYFEGSYAGKTELNPTATTDSLNVSLGIDPSVIIKREKIDNFKRKSFLGSNRIIDKGYRIEIKNSKKSNINLLLEDRIPISQNKEIKVDDIEKGDAVFDNKTGILKWKLNLVPNANTKKEFTYTVRYPKSKRINL